MVLTEIKRRIPYEENTSDHGSGRRNDPAHDSSDNRSCNVDNVTGCGARSASMLMGKNLLRTAVRFGAISPLALGCAR